MRNLHKSIANISLNCDVNTSHTCASLMASNYIKGNRKEEERKKWKKNKEEMQFCMRFLACPWHI